MNFQSAVTAALITVMNIHVICTGDTAVDEGSEPTAEESKTDRIQKEMKH